MDIAEAQLHQTERHPWELARFAILSKIIFATIGNQHAPLIVDIGAGDCFFAKQLLQRHPSMEIIAVDTEFNDAYIIEQGLHEVQRLRTFKEIDEAASFLSGRKPVMVLLLDVLEHVENDIAFLSWLTEKGLLVPGGTLLASVPAYQWLFTSHDVFLKHFRRYDRKTLEQLLEAAGFTVKDTGYFFTSLLPVRVLQKIGEKLRLKNKEHGIGHWRGNRFLTMALKHILIADARIAQFISGPMLRVPGLSLYCLCKKPVS